MPEHLVLFEAAHKAKMNTSDSINVTCFSIGKEYFLEKSSKFNITTMHSLSSLALEVLGNAIADSNVKSLHISVK